MTAAEKIIPRQIRGGRTGATYRKEAATRHEAINLYREAKTRLLNIDEWDKLSGKASARFKLCDEKGNPLIKVDPQVGHLIRIALPAPPNAQTSGFDWVRIEEFVNEKNLIKDEEVFGFRVRPVPDPHSNDQKASAHFFTEDATSTFLVVRHTNEVFGLERGRNEKPNTEGVHLFGKIRNAVIALAATLGLSTPQWKSLVTGIINGKREYQRV